MFIVLTLNFKKKCYVVKFLVVKLISQSMNGLKEISHSWGIANRCILPSDYASSCCLYNQKLGQT